MSIVFSFLFLVSFKDFRETICGKRIITTICPEKSISLAQQTLQENCSFFWQEQFGPCDEGNQSGSVNACVNEQTNKRVKL